MRGEVTLTWPRPIAWQQPAGQLIKQFCEAIPAGRITPIVVFGSAALQLTTLPTITSGDTDIAPDVMPATPDAPNCPNPLSRQEMMNLATALHLSKGQRKGLYLEICAETTFITSPRWGRRADTHRIGNAIVAIPHPYDILIAKLHRLESKDLTAFKLMVEKTAHPTEKEFLEELRAANRLFNRREYNPESHLPRQHHESKIRENTCRLWRELWGRQVNINREILEPVERELEEIIAIERPGIKESLVSGLPPKIDGQVLNKFRARSIGKHQP